MAEDPKLAAALKLARTAPPDAPLFFALVMKGGSDGALYVGKKRAAPTDIQSLKTRSGGSAVLTGRCFGEDGKLVFEMGKTPPGPMAKVLKAIMTREAGLNINVLTRLAPDLADEPPPSDEGSEQSSSESGQVGESPATRAGELTARGKALVDRSAGSAADLKNKVKLAVSQAVLYIRKGEFDSAALLLDKAEELLAQPGGQPASAPVPPAEAPDGAWQAARVKVVNDIHKIAAFVAKTKDPQGIPVVVGLESIVKNLPKALETPQAIAEVERYLREDDVVTAAEEVPPAVGTLKIREPLLAVLAELKRA